MFEANIGRNIAIYTSFDCQGDAEQYTFLLLFI